VQFRAAEPPGHRQGQGVTAGVVDREGHRLPTRILAVKPTSVTNAIRTLRFSHGEMTKAELAERIGVTRQTIIAIEQGR
jgi:DNA-binding transcriptional regulator YiaG